MAGKKISSLIEKYSGENERERRAYEEEPEVEKDSDAFVNGLLRDKLSKFSYGFLVFKYYDYMNKFHVEPYSFEDLFESSSYFEVSNSIRELLSDLGDK